MSTDQLKPEFNWTVGPTVICLWEATPSRSQGVRVLGRVYAHPLRDVAERVYFYSGQDQIEIFDLWGPVSVAPISIESGVRALLQEFGLTPEDVPELIFRRRYILGGDRYLLEVGL